MIKILKDICMECPEFPKIPEICVKMIRRVNDEEGNLFASVLSGVTNVTLNCNKRIINACHSQPCHCNVPVTLHTPITGEHGTQRHLLDSTSN